MNYWGCESKAWYDWTLWKHDMRGKEEKHLECLSHLITIFKVLDLPLQLLETCYLICKEKLIYSIYC